jgi:hypothetical protein
MAGLTLTRTRLLAGVWEGILTGARGTPALEALHRDRPVEGLSVSETGEPGRYAVRLPLPAEAIAEGVETVLIRDRATGETLDHVTIAAGPAAEADLRAEIALLRAEMDLLKAAFRRHVRDTGG